MKIAKDIVKKIQDTDGVFSIADMVIAAIITTIMTIAVAATMIGTARAYVAVADQSLSQGNAKWVLDRMKEEILQAFPILPASDDEEIMFTKHGVNLDSNDPADAGTDTVCYDFVAPSPPPTGDANCPSFEQDYEPGSIWRGVGSGGGANCAKPGDYRRVTDNMTDIRSLRIEYCVPTGTIVGEYDCTAAPENPCVWQVVISMTVARRFHPPGSALFNVDPLESAYQMKTIARPRNIYLSCFSIDTDYNGLPDGLEGTWAESI